MAKVRVKLNRKGFKELRQHPNVLADLERRAEAIAAAAGDGFGTDAGLTRTRSRAAVFTRTGEAIRAQSERGALSAAIDAGR